MGEVNLNVVCTQEDEQNWLAHRVKGISASEAAIVLGVSPYTTRHELWLEKTGQGKAFTGNLATTIGRLYEEPVAQLFAMETGYKLSDPKTLYAHVDHPWMMATPDRFVWETDEEGEEKVIGLLECKTANFRMTHLWEGQIPLPYYLQVQQQLAVMDVARAWVAVLLGGCDFRIYEIPRSDQVIQRLVEEEEAFLAYIELGVAPSEDSDFTAEALSAMRTDKIPPLSHAEATPDILEVIEVRVAAQAEEAKYTKIKENCDSQIKEWFQAHEVEICTLDAQPIVTWAERSRESLDNKSLKEAYPDIYKEFTEAKSSRTISYNGFTKLRKAQNVVK